MKKIIALLLAQLLFRFAFCQLPAEMRPTKEMLVTLKSCTLVVVMPAESQRYIDKLTKKKKLKELEDYKNAIAQYNTNIKNALQKFPLLSLPVQYMKLSEVVMMAKAEKDKCAFMVYNLSPNLRMRSEGYTWSAIGFDFYGQKKKNDFIKRYEELTYDAEKNDFAILEVYIKGKKNESQLILAKNLPHIVPTEGDLAYALMQSQKSFQETESEIKMTREEYKTKAYKNAALLKEKTLLINKDNLNKKTTDVIIKKNYPYKYKVVAQEEFDKAIIEKNPEYCYLLVVPIFKAPGGHTLIERIIFGHLIVDAASNETVVLAMSAVMMAGLGTSYFDIKEKHFDDYLKWVK